MSVDKRTLNGNNGTIRGRDASKRRVREGYYVLKDEVRAGLKARLEMVIEYYGGIKGMAEAIGVSYDVVWNWQDRGMISPDGAHKVDKKYKKDGCQGFRAFFCRPDLKFDKNGKPLIRTCVKRDMLRVVRREEAEARSEELRLQREARDVKMKAREAAAEDKAKKKAERKRKAEKKRCDMISALKAKR